MKLATRSASALDSLSVQILPNDASRVYESDEEIAAAGALSHGMDDEEKADFWRDVKRDALSRRATYERARHNRYERELVARFGIFKGIVTQPWAIRLLRWADEASRIRFIGDPLLNAHSCVIVLFMAYRGRMPADKFVFFACFLFSVHPVLVVAIGVLFAFARSRKRRPRKISSALDIDDGGLEGLYAGALVAASGVKVTVHEPGEAFVDPFRFGQRSRYETVLGPIAGLSSSRWQEVGSVEDGFAFVMQITSSSSLVARAGAEAWVEGAREATGIDKEILAVTAQQATLIASDLFAFTASQLPEDTSKAATLFKSFTDEAGGTFRAAAQASVDQALEKLGIEDVQARVALRDWVDPAGTCYSFATWCWLLAHNIDGQHLVYGLADSLINTITANGGKVLFSSGDRETKKVLKLSFSDHPVSVPLGIALFVDNVCCCFLKAAIDGSLECFVESTLPMASVLERLSRAFPDLPKPSSTSHLRINKKDSCLTSAAPLIVKGWLKAHELLGYTKSDVVVFRRNLVNEIKNMRRGRR